MVFHQPKMAIISGAMQSVKKNLCSSKLGTDFFASLRKVRDSNPRDVAAHQFSRLPPSTTRPTFQFGTANIIKAAGIPTALGKKCLQRETSEVARE